MFNNLINRAGVKDIDIRHFLGLCDVKMTAVWRKAYTLEAYRLFFLEKFILFDAVT